MEKKLVTYFEKLYENNKIGHAFLICNCTLSFIEDELNEIFSKFIFQDEVNLNNCEDIILITPENNIIKKENIHSIQEKVSTTSQIHLNKVYIISECDKMNDSASNSLLKLLEEPGKNVFAFLITNNVDSVLKTIYSRCQILKFYNEDLGELIKSQTSEEEKIECIDFLKCLENKKLNAIAYDSNVAKKLKDREYFKKFLNLVLLLYRDVLNVKFYNQSKYFVEYQGECLNISQNLSESEIIHRLDVTSKFINYLDYNLNTNMLLDRYIIEVVGEENE